MLRKRKSYTEINAARWCITREDLDFFEAELKTLMRGGKISDDARKPNSRHHHLDFGPTIYRVNEDYIIPCTKKAGADSWALMRNPDGVDIDLFATHAWIEGVFEFISKIKRLWPNRSVRGLWVCFLANPQCSLEVIKELVADVRHSPFAVALSAAGCILVIPNERGSIYGRLWCVYEAHLAVEATATTGLVIRMPHNLDYWYVCQQLAPGLLLLLTGWFVGHAFGHTTFAQYLGPLQWQVLSFVFCFMLRAVTLWIAPRLGRESLGANATYIHVIIAYVELCIAGLAAGMSLRQVEQYGSHSDKFHMRFARGQGTTVLMFIIAFVLLHVYDIYSALKQEALKEESDMLDFTTVRDADCSSKEDGDRIRQEIAGREDSIDQTIEMLLAVGRYDRCVKYNVDMGLCFHSIREGINPFKVAVACCSWSFWWMTDFSAINIERRLGYESLGVHAELGRAEFGLEDGIAAAIMVFFILCSLAMVYKVGERSVFAIDVAFWSGVWFLVASTHEFFWTEAHVKERNMTEATWLLQLGCFSAMLLVDLYFYSGVHSTLRLFSFCGLCSDASRPMQSSRSRVLKRTASGCTHELRHRYGTTAASYQHEISSDAA